MNAQMKSKCAEIRLLLHEVDRTAEQIRAEAIGGTDGARTPTDGGLDRMGSLIASSLQGAVVARARVLTRVDRSRLAAAGRAAPPTSRERILDLKECADDAEAYALAVLELAAAATRESALAVVEAVLARSDADRLSARPERGTPATPDHPSIEGA